jgi:hypothetical protein
MTTANGIRPMHDATTRARRIFAPRPEVVVFEIDGQDVETELWNFMDLPAKSSLRVYELESHLSGEKAYAEIIDCEREIVGLLCPALAPEHVAALTPRQMQDAIAASHGVVDSRPPMAESPETPSPSPGTGSSGDSATSEASTPPA